MIPEQTASGQDTAENLSFDVKNTLITEPLTLVKVWDDSGCQQTGLHYDVTFMIANSDTSKITFTPVYYYLGTSVTGTKKTTVNGNATWTRETLVLPVYYKDGTPIQYTVTETQTQKYGFYQVETADQVIESTPTGRHTGLDNYYKVYTITNKLFYEVQAPAGYERQVNTDTVITIGAAQAEANKNGTAVQTFTVDDPRKNANIKILKTDENGEPLSGAVFELHKDDTDGTIVGSAVTTGSGMNDAAIVIDTSDPGFEWGQKYYLEEKTPPTGYDADADKIYFTVTQLTAEEDPYIVRASDSRRRGVVEISTTFDLSC